MKGRLAGTVGTNASKMVAETLGSTFSEDTLLQLLSPWQWGQQMPGWEHSLQMSDRTKHQPQGRRWQTGSPLHHGNGLVINTTLFSPFVCSPFPFPWLQLSPTNKWWTAVERWVQSGSCYEKHSFGGLDPPLRSPQKGWYTLPSAQFSSRSLWPYLSGLLPFPQNFEFLMRPWGSTKNSGFAHLHPMISIISLRQSLSNRNGIAK